MHNNRFQTDLEIIYKKDATYFAMRVELKLIKTPIQNILKNRITYNFGKNSAYKILTINLQIVSSHPLEDLFDVW